MFIGIKVMWNITRGILLHNLENKNLAKKISCHCLHHHFDHPHLYHIHHSNLPQLVPYV